MAMGAGTHGQPKFELEAGKVYNIADDNYSECYVQLDDGNMIAILDKDNPGNWASLPPSSMWISWIPRASRCPWAKWARS